MSVRVTVDTSRIAPKVHNAVGRAQFILDQQVLKDENLYVPEDTGELQRSSIRASQIGKGRIIWATPYAKKMFKGIHFKFSRDKNPRAQAEWHEKAKAVHGKEWEQVAQKAVEQNL